MHVQEKDEEMAKHKDKLEDMKAESRALSEEIQTLYSQNEDLQK